LNAGPSQVERKGGGPARKMIIFRNTKFRGALSWGKGPERKKRGKGAGKGKRRVK